MLRCLREHTPCLPDWLPGLIVRRAPLILIFSLVLTVGLTVYTVLTFQIDTDFTKMVSDRLAFRRELNRFNHAFPQFHNSLLLVIKATTPEKAAIVRDVCVEHLQGQPEVFRSVFAPRGNTFLAANALLYRTPEELVKMADNLAVMQPFLGSMAREMSLENLFTMLARIFSTDTDGLDQDRLNLLLAELNETVVKVSSGKSNWISWQNLMRGRSADKMCREFVILVPCLDYFSLNPIKTAMNHIECVRTEIIRKDFADVSVNVTGKLALNVDNLISVRRGICLAGGVSLGMVLVILIWGLKSGRMVIFSLITLLTGLNWTLGFAMLAIGRLNIISITFVVLFVGLGIDYSIQFCLRYKELIENGQHHIGAIRQTLQDIGNTLLLCSLTTATGFYAFVPTSYSGASELGLIAGTGMFVNLLVNITVLPSLIYLWPPLFVKRLSSSRKLKTIIFGIPVRFPKIVLIVSAAVFLVSLFLLPKVRFDYNPINLNDQKAPSVRTARELLKQSDTSIWTASVLCDSAEEANRMAQRLETLPEVEHTMMLDDLIPSGQAQKIRLIEEMAWFMPVVDANSHIVENSVENVIAALNQFRNALCGYRNNTSGGSDESKEMINDIDLLIKRLENPDEATIIIDQLETTILVPLTYLLKQLSGLMQPEIFSAEQLPVELKSRYISDGIYRVEVFPRENLNNLEALEQFVTAVKKTAPRATGTPVGIVGAGQAISKAFMQALIIALSAVTILLVFATPRFGEVLLILAPLIISLGLTAGATVIFEIPFNFANIIVVPLLLGIGLDYGIHLVHRFRLQSVDDKTILSTSTARGVLFSALSTILSFSSLSVSSHRGTASIGIMLSLSVTIMIGCTLVVLPALLQIFSARFLSGGANERSI
jgi:hypothetical protein